MNLKTELAPKGLEFRSSDFVMSDKYCTINTDNSAINVPNTPFPYD